MEDDVGSCAKLQLTELEMLQSMYSKDEIYYDSDCAPVSMAQLLPAHILTC